MRILLVSDLDPTAVVGGGERLLSQHARGLAARGHEVVVCSGAPGADGRLEMVRILRVGRSPVTPQRAAAAVRHIHPDAVVGYQPATAIGALRAARRRGIATLYVFLSGWADEYATRRQRPRCAGIALRRTVERASLRASDRVVVLSAYSAAALSAAHPGVSRSVNVVPGGVDTVWFSPDGSREGARRRLGFPTSRPLLLAVRNLVPRMGLDILLAAMPDIVRTFPAIHLVIAGDGPLRDGLERQARSLGLAGRVTFTGLVPEQELPDYYRAADLSVLPTRDLEGFGLVTVESLACATPVVGTPVGATPEILAPLDPRLVADAATPEALAAAITSLLRSPGSIAQRARGYAVERYAWERAVACLESLIAEVAR